jgi:uncharacterized protein YkwD
MTKSIAAAATTVVAAVSFALPTTAAHAASPTAHAAPAATVTGASASAEVATMRRMINETRRRAGLPKLRASRKLDRAARLKLHRIDACHQFSHTPCGSPFTSTFRAAGGRRATMGENLAWGTSYLAAAPAILQSWMASPGHRANILRGKFRYGGFAVGTVTLAGVGAVRLWVNTFGR